MSHCAIRYKPSFLRQLKKLEPALQAEAREKIEMFKNIVHHEKLGVHKLKGQLLGFWSFSVNYRYRIVFEWVDKKTAGLIAIGDHDIYK